MAKTSGRRSESFLKRLLVGCFSVNEIRKLESSEIVSDESTVKAEPKLETEIVSENRSRCRLFTYKELSRATKGFSADSLIEEDKFGRTYKGRLRSTGEVAVKVLRPHRSYGKTEFVEEIDMLTKLNHPNLATFIGYSDEGAHRLLVYEFSPLGTLDHLLHDTDVEPLDWNTRMKIAAEVAQGLNYLVNEAKCPRMRIDIKSSNVLLDKCHHAKIYGCFRFPKVGYYLSDSSELEVLNSGTYNFGTLLLEIISGQRLVEDTNLYRVHYFLKNHKQIDMMADPRMSCQFKKRDLAITLVLVSKCTWFPEIRLPNINEVVKVFNEVLIQKGNEADTA